MKTKTALLSGGRIYPRYHLGSPLLTETALSGAGESLYPDAVTGVPVAAYRTEVFGGKALEKYSDNGFLRLSPAGSSLKEMA